MVELRKFNIFLDQVMQNPTIKMDRDEKVGKLTFLMYFLRFVKTRAHDPGRLIILRSELQ